MEMNEDDIAERNNLDQIILPRMHMAAHHTNAPGFLHQQKVPEFSDENSDSESSASHDETNEANSDHFTENNTSYDKISHDDDDESIPENQEFNRFDKSGGQCPICGKQFKHSRNVSRHINITHKASEHPYKCKQCGSGFDSSQQLFEHRELHRRPSEVHKCHICGKDLSTAYLLKLHVRIHTGEKPCKCDYCPLRFRNQRSLKRHLQIHTDPNGFECDICGKQLRYRKSLEIHKSVHNGDSPFKCNLCGKDLSSYKGLKYHKFMHGGERPYKCEVCNKSFIAKQDLNRHRKTHMKIKSHVCDICGKSFVISTLLKYHKYIHTNNKPFKCEMCSKSFIRRCDLLAHKAVHEENRAHKCDVCHKDFKTKKSMNRHKRVHLKMSVDDNIKILLKRCQQRKSGTQFDCRLCGKRFSDRNRLNTHSVIHHKVNLFDIAHKLGQFSSVDANIQDESGIDTKTINEDKTLQESDAGSSDCYDCCHCRLVFKEEKSLIEHLKGVVEHFSTKYPLVTHEPEDEKGNDSDSFVRNETQSVTIDGISGNSIDRIYPSEQVDTLESPEDVRSSIKPARFNIMDKLKMNRKNVRLDHENNSRSNVVRNAKRSLRPDKNYFEYRNRLSECNEPVTSFIDEATGFIRQTRPAYVEEAVEFMESSDAPGILANYEPIGYPVDGGNDASMLLRNDSVSDNSFHDAELRTSDSFNCYNCGLKFMDKKSVIHHMMTDHRR